MFAIADYWQRLGVTTEPYTLPQQRQRDREYVQTFPGFILYNQPTDINSLNRLRINQTPLPENSYVGNNNSRYINPEFEALIDRYFATIPQQERTTVLGQVVHHMTDVLNMIGIFHNAEPAMVANRLQGVGSRRGEGPTSQSWNAHEWDVRN
jgi:ABC-type transport system substrate-binding protein